MYVVYRAAVVDATDKIRKVERVLTALVAQWCGQQLLNKERQPSRSADIHALPAAFYISSVHRAAGRTTLRLPNRLLTNL